jgi:hypothetical protein
MLSNYVRCYIWSTVSPWLDESWIFLQWDFVLGHMTKTITVDTPIEYLVQIQPQIYATDIEPTAK